jgi:hypothetical protein
MASIEWDKLASGCLKSELKRKNISYEELIDLLGAIGIKETLPGILNKMKRGTFQFSFFLQCSKAIGIKRLHIDELIDNENDINKFNKPT